MNTYSMIRNLVSVCHGDAYCCSTHRPCRVGDGDCDFDHQCEGSTICGDHNCLFYNQEDSCCYEPKPSTFSNYGEGPFPRTPF